MPKKGANLGENSLSGSAIAMDGEGEGEGEEPLEEIWRQRRKERAG